MPVIIVDELPNRPNMISEFLAKREGFANQPTTALADCVIQAFSQTGFAAPFIDGLVPIGQQDPGLKLIEIGEAHRR